MAHVRITIFCYALASLKLTQELSGNFDLILCKIWLKWHYENLPMQNKDNFSAVKIKNFIRNLLFAQNIDCGYM